MPLDRWGQGEGRSEEESELGGRHCWSGTLSKSVKSWKKVKECGQTTGLAELCNGEQKLKGERKGPRRKKGERTKKEEEERGERAHSLVYESN